MRFLLIILLVVSGYSFSQKEDIEDFPDKEAEFPGGAKGLQEFIRNHVIYPDSAIIVGHSGKVYLQFIIEIDGSISQLEVKRSSGSRYLDREALRVIRSMPNWIPASVKSTNVRTLCRLPIMFTMDDGIDEDYVPERKKKKWWQRG